MIHQLERIADRIEAKLEEHSELLRGIHSLLQNEADRRDPQKYPFNDIEPNCIGAALPGGGVVSAQSLRNMTAQQWQELAYASQQPTNSK
jgi:hypothetical protein